MDRSLPTPQPARIEAMDIARGFALLGILIVNTRFFFQPLGLSIGHESYQFFRGIDLWFHAAVSTFFEGKFYTLFSLLFGMGMAAMLERVRSRGHTFWTIYLRRLIILGIIGFLHATLIWYGDILFIYAWTGLLLMALVPFCSVRTLLIVASVFFILSILSMTTLTGLMTFFAPSGSTPTRPLPESAQSLPAYERLLAAWRIGAAQGPESAVYISCETEAYREGPFLQAFYMRITSWVMMLIFMLLTAIPQIFSLFLIGAAMMKARFFDPQHTHWHRRCLALGFGIGIPLAIISTVAAMSVTPVRPWPILLHTLTLFPSGLLLALGMLSAAALLAQGSTLKTITTLLASGGRAALSIYLSMSIIATGLSYHWGFALFGTLSPPMLFLISIAIWVVLILLAHIWLKKFAYGPAEWLWRAGTYLTIPPLRRER